MNSAEQDPLPSIDPNLLDRLIENTFVDAAEHHTSLCSTNDRGLELASHAPDGVQLIYAENQTEGRGRGDHRWHSAPGSLTFSILVPQPHASATVLSLQVAVAIAKACNNVLQKKKVQVKWPNDLYLSNRKLGGILIEAPAHGGRWVIGIGLNVNNRTGDVIPGGSDPASLAEEAGTPLDRAIILQELLHQIGMLWKSEIASAGAPDDWGDFCLLTGRHIDVDTHHQTIRGTCRGIDATGRLLLETPPRPGESVKLQAFASAEKISWA